MSNHIELDLSFCDISGPVGQLMFVYYRFNKEMTDLEKDLLVSTEPTVYRRRWYILTGTVAILNLT